MSKAKLPTSYKGGAKCPSCKALLLHYYNYFEGVYIYHCQGCGATRYDKAARFAVRFQSAAEIGK